MKYIFGKTSAAQRLEKLLERDQSSRRRISSLLSDYTHKLTLVTDIKDPNTVRMCMKLLRDYTIKRLDIKQFTSAEEPTDIRRFAKNVVVARYRAFSKGYEQVRKTIDYLKAKS